MVFRPSLCTKRALSQKALMARFFCGTKHCDVNCPFQRSSEQFIFQCTSFSQVCGTQGWYYREQEFPFKTKYLAQPRPPPVGHKRERESEGYKGLGKSIQTTIFQRSLPTQDFSNFLDFFGFFLLNPNCFQLLIENNDNQVNGKHLDVKEGKCT